MRRHTVRLLLRQQGRCGVKFADCCCGSIGVKASNSQTAVAAAETLRRRTRTLPLRQQAWHLLLRRSHRRACSTDSRGASVASVLAETKRFSYKPWWSAMPPLVQRGGRSRREIALQIVVGCITHLCQPSIAGVSSTALVAR